MPELDRDRARRMKAEFRDDLRDLMERFVTIGEFQHGDTLKFWAGYESVDDVITAFGRFLVRRKDGDG